jgi:hypothetical protein
MRQTLYKVDDKGKVKVWKIESNAIDVTYSITNGGLTSFLQGKLKPKRTPVVKGANIGKSNELTPYERLLNIVDKKIADKKKKSWYSLTDLGIVDMTKRDIDTYKIVNHKNYVMYKDKPMELGLAIKTAMPTNMFDRQGHMRPMLAKQYKDITGKVKNEIKFPCISQPKLNGHRSTNREEIQQDGLFTNAEYVFRTRQTNKIVTLNHIQKDIKKIYQSILVDRDGYIEDIEFKVHISDIIFDGEIYKHGMPLQDISSAVKKRNADTPTLKYCIYDLALPNVRYNDRLKLLEKIFSKFKLVKSSNKFMYNVHIDNSPLYTICLIESIPVADLHQAYKKYDEFLEAGYEGAIYRYYYDTYKSDKRTLIKHKPAEDNEFEIINVIPSGRDAYNGKPIGQFKCKTALGEIFKVVPQMSKIQRYDLLQNKHLYIGKQVTVKYYDLTNKGIPFNAVALAIRDYE